MKRLLEIGLVILACLVSDISVSQSRFSCNGKSIISLCDGKQTSLAKVATIPFSAPFLSTFLVFEKPLDGLGFNPADHFIYAVEQNTNHIVRLSNDGAVQIIGEVANLDTLRSYAGDCKANGQYVCYDHNLHQMLVFDVVDEFKLVKKIDLFWNPKSSNTGAFKSQIFDFAFDPYEPNIAYSYQGLDPSLGLSNTAGKLLKINLNLDSPEVGMVTVINNTDPWSFSHLAGMSFSPTSDLSGFGSFFGGFNPPQSTVFSINKDQGQSYPLLTHYISYEFTDACSCPFSLELTNAVPQDGMYCNNDVKTFTINILNNSYITISGAVLKDTFPVGTFIKSISNRFKGTIDGGTGIGTNILSISSLEIPAKELITITIELQSLSAIDGFAHNQVFLHSLPLRFPSSFFSDDPLSSAEGDRSNFFFKTRSIQNLTWNVTPASDCILANDGKITFMSNDLVPGDVFEVSLRNKVGWKEYVVPIVIDSMKSFTIDSLPPGDYQLFRLKSLPGNCSLSLKDTTIILNAPNHLVNINMSTNSPICSGEDLLLNADMMPKGSMTWYGPELYSTIQDSNIIKGALPSQSGQYKVVANYGLCSKEVSEMVEIKEQFTTTITGDSTYCIRDSIKLEANSYARDVMSTWYGPNDIVIADSILTINVTHYNQSGIYQVRSTNNACFDTANIAIYILPTPTLSLDSLIFSDFCSPIQLQPSLYGDNDAVLDWTPKEGLSCYNCLEPDVVPIVQSSYNLVATSTSTCTDSVKVTIQLDKKNIAFSPNVFTPQGNTQNNTFGITPNCIVKQIHKLVVYDRHGSQVYLSDSMNNGESPKWDGSTIRGIIASGVYVWVAKIEMVDGTFEHVTGDVTVIK
jgi:hypothetical protein